VIIDSAFEKKREEHGGSVASRNQPCLSNAVASWVGFSETEGEFSFGSSAVIFAYFSW